jgi:hypothetical protein
MCRRKKLQVFFAFSGITLHTYYLWRDNRMFSTLRLDGRQSVICG